ncbi:dihydrodipicolinate synthase family protein [Streptomyces sp. NPDC059897]|uniref:dihydrodipicolinate synthase family protein n=1 Tax=Streptomyces sp. NPDC059897 TaxID=3346994 RepID=UPI00365110ED
MTLQNGILTALATPYDQTGDIDEKLLRVIVDRSVDGGVSGVVAGGSTGEFATMTGDERRLLVETVVDQAAGRVPVIAQTGAVATREAVALTRHAEKAGADVVMVVAPYYETLTMDETLRYLRTVAGSVSIPVMLYNIPDATGVNLDPDTVGALAREVENIKYIKDTSADMAQAGQLIHRHGDVIDTFLGWDSLLLASVAEGAAGVMAGSANVMAADLVAVHQALTAGDLKLARARWKSVFPLMDTLMTGGPFIQGVRAAMEEIGLPVGPPREPLLPVEAAHRERIRAALAGLPHLNV